MEVDLTPEQTDFLRYAVQTGRVRDPAEAVQQALSLWMEQSAAAPNSSRASMPQRPRWLEEREGPSLGESMKSLARDVMERNRHRFPVKSQAKR